jgi:hypothetical protein
VRALIAAVILVLVVACGDSTDPTYAYQLTLTRVGQAEPDVYRNVKDWRQVDGNIFINFWDGRLVVTSHFGLVSLEQRTYKPAQKARAEQAERERDEAKRHAAALAPQPQGGQGEEGG